MKIDLESFGAEWSVWRSATRRSIYERVEILIIYINASYIEDLLSLTIGDSTCNLLLLIRSDCYFLTHLATVDLEITARTGQYFCYTLEFD